MTRRFQLLGFLVLACGLALPAVAQVGSLPPNSLRSSQPGMAAAVDARRELRLPRLDRDQLRLEDEQRAAAGQPARFAVSQAVAITPANAGVWDALSPDLARWQLRVLSPGASSLNFAFRRFSLPAGAQLRLLGAGGRYSRRPFTTADAAAGGELWTPIVLGEEATLELTVPQAQRSAVDLELMAVNQGYRGFGASLDKSGSCNVDVACAEADPWRNQVQSVAVYSINGILLCTGAMVQNTVRDFRPLFLTASHCNVTPNNAASVVVYWNYQNSTCRQAGTSSSGQAGDGSFDQAQSGATFLAGYKASDFVLMQLNQPPDPEWNVFWAGWDRRNVAPSQAFTVHHPAVDEKRISFENDPLSITSYANSLTPGDATHLRIADWDVGTTEPGSSGAPLFDAAGHIVGQLHGGFAACGNNLPDWYGRLAVSWEGGGTASTRLRDWLDPLASGAELLDGASPVDLCANGSGTLCLRQGRFLVTTRWTRSNGTSGDGVNQSLSDDTGYFWFFKPSNIEMVVKVLDGCAKTDHFWVFAGGLTNVEVEIVVTDTATGQVRVYQNPPMTPFLPLQDTGAFACP